MSEPVQTLPDTPNLRAYDDAIASAAFMRDQARAMMDNAAQIEFDAKKKAREYVDDDNQNPTCYITGDGEVVDVRKALLPLRHRLMCKELGHDVGFDGPSPNIKR